MPFPACPTTRTSQPNDPTNECESVAKPAGACAGDATCIDGVASFLCVGSNTADPCPAGTHNTIGGGGLAVCVVAPVAAVVPASALTSSCDL